MKSFKSTIIITAFFISGLLVGAQSTSDFHSDVTNEVKAGNATALSRSFNQNVELTLPGKTGVFSREQAGFVVGDFFKKHPSLGFEIIHKGNREKASFFIGKYLSGADSYRFYFLVKNQDSKILIHKLRIEKQDE